MGKEAIKKSTTLLDNIGSGSAIYTHELVSVTDRTAGGTIITIRDSQDTATKANVGDVLKYVNITIQAANRDTNVEPGDSGWLEWGISMFKESTPTFNTSQFGTQTLGDSLTKAQRGNVLLTGVIPVGSIQPITQNIKIKIPANRVKLQLGSNLILYCYFRSTDSTDIRTDSVRIVTSALYKLYV